jgi:hypothetical protein
MYLREENIGSCKSSVNMENGCQMRFIVTKTTEPVARQFDAYMNLHMTSVILRWPYSHIAININS